MDNQIQNISKSICKMSGLKEIKETIEFLDYVNEMFIPSERQRLDKLVDRLGNIFTGRHFLTKSEGDIFHLSFQLKNNRWLTYHNKAGLTLSLLTYNDESEFGYASFSEGNMAYGLSLGFTFEEVKAELIKIKSLEFD
jgi:hypothetical protein